jgi:XTP/dITP diphosphohydrolase
VIKEIILATGNKHKTEEIKNFFKDLNIKILPMTAFEKFPEVIEDGKTLAENAVKKAVETAVFFNEWTLADDTGLEVDFLNGGPGIYSARYAGEQCSFEDNNKKLLSALRGVSAERRTAKLKTVVCISSPDKKTYMASGEICGTILDSSSGSNGFGYDPLFFIHGINKTLAELSLQEKNTISHRAKALKKATEIIKKL